MRVQHMVAIDEDATLSQPVTFDLQSLLPNRQVRFNSHFLRFLV
jgi:hypothetical protein